jgi:N-acetylmuramoyl-L-alanine amidase
MMTKYKLVIIIILFIIPVENSYAATTRLGTVTASLKLRSGPSLRYRVRKVIPRRTVLKIYASSGNWYRTTYGGTTGYVYKRYVSLHTTSTKATRVRNDAIRFLGVRYVWGGTTPRGFDCSGYVQYLYKRQGVYLPRVAQQQSRVGRIVSRSNMRVGDLMYFSSTRRLNRVTHVGIYIGNGNFIHASSVGRVVITNVNKAYYRRNLVRIRRVF